MPGCFVTGTDTGAGKSVLAAAIIAALRARGTPVRALKPIITGLNEPADPDWPPDHELLSRAAGCAPEEVLVVGFEPPVSPHLAASLSGRPIDVERLVRTLRGFAAGTDTLVIEGVGGLRVPISGRYDVRSLAADLALPLVIAARPGLGTINHTLLTLEAARTAGLRAAGVVLTPWPSSPGRVERSNRDTIERLGEVAVSVLAEVPRAEPRLLAAAGDALPLDEWLG